ncbi:MAG: hypothetical protein WDZ51_01425 [Pirellulaceae bacterium]
MQAPAPARLPDPIRATLDSLRRKIRGYVFQEGIAIVAIWLIAAFWIGLAIDYLPVTLGAKEMPVAARAVLLAVTGIGLLYLTYRYIARRIFARMRDESLALLIERRFSDFDESLLTTVQAADSPYLGDPIETQLLNETRVYALATLPSVNLKKIFDPTPLWRKGTVAILLILSVVLFATAAQDAFSLWTQRFLLLADSPWPRMAQVEIVGLEIADFQARSGSDGEPNVVSFNEDRTIKVARGSSVRLLARANTDAPVVPRYCTLRYRSDDGASGSVRMQRVQVSEDQFQNYVFDRKPLSGMMASLRFDVVGYDHAVEDYRIEVVDRPSILEVYVDAKLPEYTQLLPRREQLTGATRLPMGATLNLTFHSNKPITEATLIDLKTQESETIAFDSPATSFVRKYESIETDIAMEVSLLDNDGVRSEFPHRIQIAAVPDTPPSALLEVEGLGPAITTDAIMPLVGQVTDDYGVAHTEINLQVIGGNTLSQKLGPSGDGEVRMPVDLKEHQSGDGVLKLKAGDKLTAQLSATDHSDLVDGGNIGTSERLQFDIVTQDKLLSLLEGRELALRRRFEQILEETIQLREEYVRVGLDAKRFQQGPAAFAPTDDQSLAPEQSPTDTAQTRYERALDLQKLRIQRATQASRKAQEELQGISNGFEEIRRELTQNRLDTAARKERLGQMIIEPITRIADVMHSELQETTAQLERQFDQPNESLSMSNQAVQETERIILEMREVLDKMFDLETFNELVEQMREIIEAQSELREETEKERKRQILELLE